MLIITSVSRCPDMEGIETNSIILQSCHIGVSRCPDMEGIETVGMDFAKKLETVSVGAPTWRGLKQRLQCLISDITRVSVGAPTWRGLKQKI